MCIHGDKAQAERDWVLSGESHARFKEKGSCFSVFFVSSSEFRAGKSPILIATDVASRGLGTVCGAVMVEGGSELGRRGKKSEVVAESLCVVDALLQLLMSICSLATGMPALNCSVAA